MAQREVREKGDFWFEPWDFEGLREKTRLFAKYLEIKKQELLSKRSKDEK